MVDDKFLKRKRTKSHDKVMTFQYPVKKLKYLQDKSINVNSVVRAALDALYESNATIDEGPETQVAVKYDETKRLALKDRGHNLSVTSRKALDSIYKQLKAEEPEKKRR